MAVDVVFEVDDEGKLLCAVDFQHYDGPRMLDVTIYVKELSDDRINHARNQRLDTSSVYPITIPIMNGLRPNQTYHCIIRESGHQRIIYEGFTKIRCE